MDSGMAALLGVLCGIVGSGITLLLWMRKQTDRELAGSKPPRGGVALRVQKYVLYFAVGAVLGGLVGFVGTEQHHDAMWVMLAALAAGIVPTAALKFFKGGLPS